MSYRHLKPIIIGAGTSSKGFVDGIDYDSSPFEMPSSASPDCANVLPQTIGSIKTRKGYNRHNSSAVASGAAVTGVIPWYNQGGTPTERFNCQAGTGFFENTPEGTWTDRTGALTITNDQNNLASVAILVNVLVVANRSRDALYQWTGSGNATAVGGNPPNGRFVFNFGRRIFLGGNSTNPLLLYYSAIDNQASWTTSTDFLNFDEGDGVELTGGVPTGTATALVFKNKSIHQIELTGTFPPFTRKLLYNGIGCVSNNSVVQLPDGSALFWDTDDVYRIYGNEVTSASVYPESKRPRLRRFFRDLVNTSRLQYVVGAYYPLLDVVRYFYSTTNSSTHDAAMDYHVKTRSWWPHTGLVGNAVGIRTVSGQPRLMVGDYSGFVTRHDTTLADNGTAIAMKYSLPQTYHGDSNVRKKAFEFRSTIQRDANYNVTADIYIDGKTSTDVTGTMSLASLAGAVWDTAVWNTDTWATESASQEASITINRLYKSIRCAIRHNGLNQPVTIQDMTILTRPLEITRATN